MMVATLFEALPSSSSHVIIKSEFCAVKADEARIVGTALLSHVSPVLTEQSCMSLHRFGVIQTKFGVVAGVARSIASCV